MKDIMNKNQPMHPANIMQMDYFGLTKREYFVGLALQGYISAGVNGMPDEKDIVFLSVSIADALLKELEK